MSLQYKGRANAPDVGFGNKCFLFFSSYIYAKLHNLKIEASGDRNPQKKVKEIIKLKNCQDIWYKNGGKKYDKKVIIQTSMYKDGILPYQGEFNAVFDGYFHDSRYLIANMDLINNIIDLDHYRKPILEKMNYNIGENDVLCQVRLGDFVRGNSVLHPDYFLNILDENNYDNIYFIAFPLTDKHLEKYFSHFEKYRKKIILINHDSIEQDFYFSHLFKNIIVSNSTFNWWSVFLNSQESSIIHLPLDIKNIHYNKMNDSCKHYPAKYISSAELKEP